MEDYQVSAAAATFWRDRVIYGMVATYIGRGFPEAWMPFIFPLRLAYVLQSIWMKGLAFCSLNNLEVINYSCWGIASYCVIYCICWGRGRHHWIYSRYNCVVLVISSLFLWWRVSGLAVATTWDCFFVVDLFTGWVAVSRDDPLVWSFQVCIRYGETIRNYVMDPHFDLAEEFGNMRF